MAATRIASSGLTRYFIRCFQVFGHWMDAQHSSLFYRIFSVGVRCWYLIYLSFLIAFLYDANELEEITNSLYISLTVTAMLVKIFNFANYNDGIRGCLQQTHDFRLQTDEEWKLYRSRHKSFAIKMISYYTVCYCAVFMQILNAMVRAQPTLPFRGAYPLNWRDDHLHYWLVFIFQSLGMVSCLHMNVTLEQFECFMLYEVSIQFEMLCSRIENFGWNSKKDSNVHFTELRQWVQRHNDVVKYDWLAILIRSFNC